MLHIFMYAANCLLPIISLMLLGCALHKVNLLDGNFLAMGNKLQFNFILPLMLLNNIYNIESIGNISWNIIILAVSMLLFFFVLGILIAKFVIQEEDAKGVITLITFCPNYIILGLALAGALAGSAGSSVSSIISAFTVPLMNVLAMVALTIFRGGENRRTVWQYAKEILSMPVTISALMGLAILAIRALIPTNADGELVFSIKNNLPFIYSTVGYIAKLSTPFALIILGGLLDFSAIRGKLKNILWGLGLRSFVSPLIGIPLVLFLNHIGWIQCGRAEYAALITFFCAPAAVSCAVLASETNNDGELARQIIMWSHVISMVTVFIAVVLFMSAGLL